MLRGEGCRPIPVLLSSPAPGGERGGLCGKVNLLMSGVTGLGDLEDGCGSGV